MNANPWLPGPLHPRRIPTDQWWRHAVIYQIYPRSFADSNGDGIGDLQGIISRLPYLVSLGIDAIWLSPFYVSPHADAGYDVADYCDVDPIFGTLSDFDELRTGTAAVGLRLIVDLVPNHSSDEHAWFREAIAAGPGSPERTRYIFRDGKGPQGQLPPNNWESFFGGPAWTRVETDHGPEQWYLHLFDTKQPDLNWSNPEVVDYFDRVLRFWLDRGVDGFRVDVAHGLVKAEGLPDTAAPREGLEGPGHRGPMWDQDDVHEIYRRWHRLLAGYEHEPILVAEAWVEPLERLARYVRSDEMHQAFNFPFMFAGWNAQRIRTIIDGSLAANGQVGAASTWVLSNHDVVRHASRFGLVDQSTWPQGISAGDTQPDAELGLARARAAILLMLALPGSAYLYQGEELGLAEHTTLADDARQDPTFRRTGGDDIGRDGCRVPLPWQAAVPGYGFGPTSATWLPQPASFGPLAVDRQEQSETSTLNLYRKAIMLRRRKSLGSGGLHWIGNAADILDFHNGTVRVIVNFSEKELVLPEDCSVLLQSSPDVHPSRTLASNGAVWLRMGPGPS